MNTHESVDQRLTDLEIKASFNEDVLDQLNQIIVRQQQEIALLQRDVRELRQRAPEAGSAAPPLAADDLPPHY